MAPSAILPLLAATTAFAGHGDHRMGLRWAERVSATEVKLTFGASFVEHRGRDANAYRVVSPTDPDFQHGVRGASVHVSGEDDAQYPAGWQGRRYHRFVVVVELPTPMKPGHRHWVQAMGVNHQPVTGGRAAHWIMPSGAKPPESAIRNRLGLRGVQIVAPDTIMLTLGPGVHTPPERADNIEVAPGPPFPAGDIPPHDPDLYVLRSEDDPDFAEGQPAIRMGRRSRIDCYYTDGWPYGTFKKHEVFLQFGRPLKEEMTYSIDLNEARFPITCGESKGELRLSSRQTVNPIIKVNQLGYLPDAPAKYAYVGAWMGSLGTLDLSFVADAHFEVRNAETHEVALRGKPRLRLAHTFSLTPDGELEPKGAKGKETVYQHDLSYEDIYELDLSGLKQTGSYYVALPGMGRSFTFRIGPDVYEEAYRTCIRGVFHQRCGIEMREPYTLHYHPACHRGKTELTDLVRGQGSAFELLPKHVIDPTKRDLFGGHHDAGDYNPRSHLDVVQLLFTAYELTPAKYYDGQSNIPESGNGVPDIIDEAKWGLDLWIRLQDEDGGVRNGTESDGDPDMITTPEIDYKRDFAFAKDAPASLRFAGTAAQASIIWDGLGSGQQARALLDRARRAYRFAVANAGDAHADELVYAAVQLYRATGEKRYLADFHRHTVFADNPDAELRTYKKHDQELASFYYAFCNRPVDDTIRASIIRAFQRRMATWIRFAETVGYRYMRDPWAPNTWGTGAYPLWMLTAMEAYTLTKAPEYLKWIQLTCDFSLGCNPMNTVFTVGLGKRFITGPLHMYGRYSPDGPIQGTQCQGPSSFAGGVPAKGSMTSWIGAGLFPRGPWPQLHTYTDVQMSPGMNEGTVSNMAKTAIAYGFLMPDRSARRR